MACQNKRNLQIRNISVKCKLLWYCTAAISVELITKTVEIIFTEILIISVIYGRFLM